jgi:vacuolar iron transporter family protein
VRDRNVRGLGKHAKVAPLGMRSQHREVHRFHRVGWLRAAVLGANDGIVSVASLVIGVAAGGKSRADVILASIAGLFAGAMSMAAGEYVSVKSQSDSEAAELAIERRELRTNPVRELDELTEIYMERGLDEPLARRVAEKLSAGDTLAVHAREELGITEDMRARPLQAAAASAGAFSAGAILPVLAAWLSPFDSLAAMVGGTTVVALALVGAFAAWAAGSPIVRSTLRVTLWGIGAMAVTAAAGRYFGAAP